MFQVPNEFRVRNGVMGSRNDYGNNGAFLIPTHDPNWSLVIIASDQGGWEHVSVHCESKRGIQRTPIWKEMCQVKALFWGQEDLVMELHPRASQYVNDHEHTLHLWRPVDVAIPEPPAIMVGRGRKNGK